MTGSATVNSAGSCPALAPAAISWASPMPAADSGAGRARSFRMNWSTMCLPSPATAPRAIAAGCVATGCRRAAHGVSLWSRHTTWQQWPSPAMTNGSTPRPLGDDADVLHPRDTVHSRPPTFALATLHVPSTARGAPWLPVMSAATTTTRALPAAGRAQRHVSIRSSARSTHCTPLRTLQMRGHWAWR